MNTYIDKLDELVPNPSLGLPDDIFYYISRTTPLINVDLLIKDKDNRVLLSWRDDKYTGKGWHIPGGIIRYKESIENRINEVAKNELKAEVYFDSEAIALNQVITKEQRDRAHFISLLYNCTIKDEYIIDNGDLEIRDAGYLKWHKTCPDDLLSYHEIYRKYLN